VGDLTLDQAGDVFQNIGIRVFWAMVLMVLVYLVNKALVWLLDRLAERSAERRLFYKRLVPLVRILVWSIGLYVVIRFVFQVNAQSLVAATAAIGVAVGFAAQDLLKNIFGGLVIISDRPFQVGDKISVAGTYGEVASIGLRSTRIITPDDNLVSVPNAQVVDSQVANANAGALDCQVVTSLYLPGWVDERLARRLAYEAAASSKFVYRRKPIVVLVKDEFDKVFLTHLMVKAYVIDTRYEFLLMTDITERCREAFREHGLLTREDGLSVLLRGGVAHD
ncbi:MAG: mechanosensitive ion channel, partial [Bacteroidetes bacterium]|nr:mechanosensitive ion channel [Bacteroidota bacterium]